MIKSRFTLKQLEAFVFVVDLGSFRAAADALGTTQPNVSARISALEKMLDCVLMQRDAGSVRLTEAGERLLAPARETLRTAEGFLEAAERKDLITERLRLGVTELIACTWLHDFLRAFKGEYPSISVELDVDLSREIERRLTANQLDLAFQTGPFKANMPDTLPLGTYPYVWVCAPEVRKRLGNAPSLAELFHHPILSHAKSGTATSELLAEAKSRKLPLEQIGTISSLVACQTMAADGMGLAVLPHHAVRDAVSAGELVTLDCPWLPSPLEVFARYDKARTAGFVDFAAKLSLGIAAKDK